MLDEIRYEALTRDRIRDEIKYGIEGCGVEAVVGVTHDVYHETGYDLAGIGREESLVEEEVRVQTVSSSVPLLTNGELDELDELPALERYVPRQRVKLVPRFAAAVVVSLVAKFGRLGYNEANRLLIEREYLAVCRAAHVRNTDVAFHLMHVINAYFNEDVPYQLPTVRQRVPAWLRRAFGSPPKARNDAC